MCNWDTNRTAVTSLEGAERTGTCGRSVPWVDEHKRPRQALSVFARRLTPYFYGSRSPGWYWGILCVAAGTVVSPNLKTELSVGLTRRCEPRSGDTEHSCVHGVGCACSPSVL